MPRGLAGEHAADHDLFDASVSMKLDLGFVELGVRDEHLARVRVDDVLERDATEDASPRLDDDLAGSSSAVTPPSSVPQS
jgi:hypothetical protein